jgi:nuclease S1
MPRPTRHIALVVLAALSATGPAMAWGPAGHQAVAQVAASRLTPDVQKQVAMLLGGQTLPDVAVWADDVRETTHRHTTPWHFTNIPVTSSGYSSARDCRQGNCVVAVIGRQEAVLRDPTRGRLQRSEALKFLVHFLGDIHQPLHAGDAEDRGGNERRIVQIGNAVNLHAAWDSGILQSNKRTTATIVAAANAWLKTQQEPVIARGSAIDWANESHRISRDVVYAQVRGDNAIVGAEQQQALRIIDERVARAGVRLAAVLNRALAVAKTE